MEHDALFLTGTELSISGKGLQCFDFVDKQLQEVATIYVLPKDKKWLECNYKLKHIRKHIDNKYHDAAIL